MSNDELATRLNALMRHYHTHADAALMAIDKLGNSNNVLSEFLTHLIGLPKPVYDELMANAIRHDNAKDQLIEAFELMKIDFEKLAQAMLKATE